MVEAQGYTVASLDGTVYSLNPSGESVVRDERAEQTFRSAMRLLPTGVALVVVEVDDKPWAMTVSACCSLSAAPPRLLVSLSQHTVTLRQIFHDRRFGIGILSANQQELAEFGAAPGSAKFLGDAQLDVHFANDRHVRFVRGALAYFECRYAQSLEVGDHSIVVADVEEALIPESPSQPAPLVYFQAAFRRLADEDRSFMTAVKSGGQS